MSEVNPHVLAQLHRIHQAVNAGTLDKDTVNDALRLIHDYLSGAADEDAPSEDTPPDVDVIESGGEAPAVVVKKQRKKR